MPESTTKRLIDPASAVIALVDGAKANKGCVVGVQTRLLEDAGIDSIRLMELIEDVQRDCNVVFLPEDYNFEDFASVESIANVVSRRLSYPPP